MRRIPGEFPIDPGAWTYTVRGTGAEPQGWTCGRDVARAVVALLDAENEWVTYFYHFNPLFCIYSYLQFSCLLCIGARDIRHRRMGHVQPGHKATGEDLW